jgi:hypothetical protein
LQLFILWDLGNYNIQTSKFYFFGVFFTVNFFTPKLHGLLFFFGSFAPHFQIKLSTHGSNLNSMFVIMSELNFILLTRVLTQNFNTMDLVKVFGKNQKLYIYIIIVTLKVTSCKIKILWTKQTSFRAPYPSALGQF